MTTNNSHQYTAFINTAKSQLQTGVVEGELKETTKSGKIRIVPIGSNLLTILKKT